MQIYIIRHATKVGEFMEKTTFFSLDNAKAKLRELAQNRLKELSEHVPNTELKDHEDRYSEIFINGTKMEDFMILTFETEDIGTIKEDILKDEAFPISCLSKADLEEKGFDTSEVTTDQMKRLASRMGDDYCEQMFWTSLEIIAEEGLEIQKLTPLENLKHIILEFFRKISFNDEPSEWTLFFDDDADALNWTFFDDDNNGYTDRATAVRLEDGKVEVRWEGERCHPACWEPLKNIEDEDNYEDFLNMLTNCVKEALN